MSSNFNCSSPSLLLNFYYLVAVCLKLDSILAATFRVQIMISQGSVLAVAVINLVELPPSSLPLMLHCYWLLWVAVIQYFVASFELKRGTL